MGKIMITGIAGLMGSRLADWILENTKHKVVGIDDLSGGYRSNINKKVKFYHFDLAKNRAVSGTTYSTTEGTYNLKLIFKKEKPDIVYHFAGAATRTTPEQSEESTRKENNAHEFFRNKWKQPAKHNPLNNSKLLK